MNNRKKTVVIGISLLFTVFLTLCLLTFGVLSFVTARSSANLVRRSAEHKKAYYDSVFRAEEALKSLSRDSARIPEACLDFSEEDGAVTFLIALSDRQVLFVRAEKGEKGLEPVEMRTLSTAEFHETEYYHLLDFSGENKE